MSDSEEHERGAETPPPFDGEEHGQEDSAAPAPESEEHEREDTSAAALASEGEECGDDMSDAETLVSDYGEDDDEMPDAETLVSDYEEQGDEMSSDTETIVSDYEPSSSDDDEVEGPRPPTTPFQSVEGVELAMVPEQWKTEGGLWVILACIPRVAHRDRAFPPGFVNLRVRFDVAPRATRVTVHKRLAPHRKALDNYPFIAAATPKGRLLLCASQGPDPDPPSLDGFAREPLLHHGAEMAYFIFNAWSGRASRVPKPPLPIRNPANACFIALNVFELQPTLGADHAALLCYSTLFKEWTVLDLNYPPRSRPWGDHGTIHHDGKIWWVDLSFGLLYGDAVGIRSGGPRLSFVGLPDGCALPPGLPDLDRRRFVGVNAGALRYVQIHQREHRGNHAETEPVVSMWTLIKRENWEWRYDTTAPFEQIWNDDGYKATKLRPEVPAIALIHPIDRAVVYFFQQSRIFGVDLLSARVVDWQYFAMLHPPLPYQSSRFVRAWEVPHALFSGSTDQTSAPSTSNTDKGSAEGSGPSNSQEPPIKRYHRQSRGSS